MAAPKDTLRVFQPRGLTDFPEGSPYGSAYLAKNVEWDEGWLRPRRGTDCWNTCYEASAGILVERILFVREFRGRTNRLVLVIVVERADHTIGITVSNPGAEWTWLDQLGTTRTVGPGRVSAVEFGTELILFLPTDPVSAVVVNVDEPHLPGPFGYSDVHAGSPSADAGPFFSIDRGDVFDAKFGCVHDTRVFYAGFSDDARVVRYSSVLWPRLVCTTNLYAFGGPVTGLASFTKALVVFTRYSVHVWEFSGQADKSVEPLLRHTGCVAHNSIVQAGHRLIFLSDNGLLSMDQTGNIAELSAPVRRTLLRYSHDFEHATVVHYAARHQLWLLLPAARRVFVYSLITGHWSTFEFTDVPDGRISIEALALSREDGIDLPVLGVLDAAHNVSVVITERGPLHDKRCARCVL